MVVTHKEHLIIQIVNPFPAFSSFIKLINPQLNRRIKINHLHLIEMDFLFCIQMQINQVQIIPTFYKMLKLATTTARQLKRSVFSLQIRINHLHLIEMDFLFCIQMQINQVQIIPTFYKMLKLATTTARQLRRSVFSLKIRGRAVVTGSDLKAKNTASQLPGRGGGQFKHLVKCGDDLYLIDLHLDAEQEIHFDAVEVIDFDMPIQLRVYKLNKAGNCICFSEEMFTGSNEEEESLEEFCGDTGVYKLNDGSCGMLALFPDHWPLF
ncbi:hypothetical protein Vadar_017885 [Vaccinium darrowii]|uniref:Uncharacterized protein n=1 Tax=Vaccinium darrowii TaxID=229202 RepID=A0ACB7ZJV4_9ERIC|nr:hypothetical protein Vadar_017885 [Vaccinium darrowii]